MGLPFSHFFFKGPGLAEGKLWSLSLSLSISLTYTHTHGGTGLAATPLPTQGPFSPCTPNGRGEQHQAGGLALTPTPLVQCPELEVKGLHIKEWPSQRG